MKWSFASVGMIVLGITGIAIILLFQQITTSNENDYYLLKEITEASMIESIDLKYYRETGDLKIIKDFPIFLKGNLLVININQFVFFTSYT